MIAERDKLQQELEQLRATIQATSGAIQILTKLIDEEEPQGAGKLS